VVSCTFVITPDASAAALFASVELAVMT